MKLIMFSSWMNKRERKVNKRHWKSRAKWVLSYEGQLWPGGRWALPSAGDIQRSTLQHGVPLRWKWLHHSYFQSNRLKALAQYSSGAAAWQSNTHTHTSLSLTHTHTHTHSLSHTHTHTHTRLSHTHTHTHTLGVWRYTNRTRYNTWYCFHDTI